MRTLRYTSSPAAFQGLLSFPLPGTQSSLNRRRWHGLVYTARKEMEMPQGYNANPALHVRPCGFSRSFVFSLPGTQSSLSRRRWHGLIYTARKEMEMPQGYKANPALHAMVWNVSRAE